MSVLKNMGMAYFLSGSSRLTTCGYTAYYTNATFYEPPQKPSLEELAKAYWNAIENFLSGYDYSIDRESQLVQCRFEPNSLAILMRAVNILKTHVPIRQPCWRRGRWKSLT